jgi:hypothetical protein
MTPKKNEFETVPTIQTPSDEQIIDEAFKTKFNHIEHFNADPDESVVQSYVNGKILLEDAWKRSGTWGGEVNLKEHIRTEQADPRVSAYLQLKNVIDTIPDSVPPNKKEIIRDFFEAVLDSAAQYMSKVYEYNIIKKEGQDRATAEQLEPVDEARRYSHNALIDNLEILRRLCKENGLDISWQNGVGYGDRVSIREWAEKVIQYLRTLKEMEG